MKKKWTKPTAFSYNSIEDDHLLQPKAATRLARMAGKQVVKAAVKTTSQSESENKKR